MAVKDIINKAVKEGRKLLTVDESLEFLKGYGIPIAEYALVDDLDGALKVARRFGYPIVLKLVSKEASHKTDVGGVFVGIKTDDEMGLDYRKLVENAKKAGVGVDKVFVQKMVVGGQEVIIGGKKDPQFGQTILFGAGGIYVEAYGDASIRVVPISKADASEMMKDTVIFKVLEKFRGKSYDIGSLEDMLMKTSKLLEEHREISELDINPLMALPKGKGAVAVDARILLE